MRAFVKVNELITFVNRNGIENFNDLDSDSWVSYEQAKMLLVNKFQSDNDTYVRVKTTPFLLKWSVGEMTIQYDINVTVDNESFSKQCTINLELSRFEWIIISVDQTTF